MEPIVVLENVSKSFLNGSEHVRVLSDISMSIMPGEFVVLMGANGVGKSTLAGLVAGIDSDFEGRIVRAQTTDRTFPMVFQDYKSSLLPWLSVEENISFPLFLKGRSGRDRRDAARGLLEKSPSRISPNSPVKGLSGGQAQLVCILRGLAASPRLLVCDEPFSAIDYPARISLRNMLIDICRQQGIAVLFVTHSIEDAALIADRVIFLKGRPATIEREITSPSLAGRNEQWLDELDGVEFRRRLRKALDQAILN